jgi:hypothetical protein
MQVNYIIATQLQLWDWIVSRGTVIDDMKLLGNHQQRRKPSVGG